GPPGNLPVGGGAPGGPSTCDDLVHERRRRAAASGDPPGGRHPAGDAHSDRDGRPGAAGHDGRTARLSRCAAPSASSPAAPTAWTPAPTSGACGTARSLPATRPADCCATAGGSPGSPPPATATSPWSGGPTPYPSPPTPPRGTPSRRVRHGGRAGVAHGAGRGAGAVAVAFGGLRRARIVRPSPVRVPVPSDAREAMRPVGPGQRLGPCEPDLRYPLLPCSPRASCSPPPWPPAAAGPVTAPRPGVAEATTAADGCGGSPWTGGTAPPRPPSRAAGTPPSRCPTAPAGSAPP